MRTVSCAGMSVLPDRPVTTTAADPGSGTNRCVPTAYAVAATAVTATRRKTITDVSLATSNRVRPTGRTSR